MATKLKSVFLHRLSPLWLKTALFAGFFSLLWLSGGGFFTGLFFVLAVSVIYANPLFQTSRFFFSFLGLLIVALWVAPSIEGELFVLALFSLSMLFYLLLALKDVQVIHRREWHYVLVLALLYGLFLLFFASSTPSRFWGTSIGLTTLIFLLAREFFKNNTFLGLFIALIALEALWVVQLLPLGFLNAASVVVLVIYGVLNTLRHATRGSLTPRLVLTDATIVILLLVLIFGVTTWTL